MSPAAFICFELKYLGLSAAATAAHQSDSVRFPLSFNLCGQPNFKASEMFQSQDEAITWIQRKTEKLCAEGASCQRGTVTSRPERPRTGTVLSLW